MRCMRFGLIAVFVFVLSVPTATAALAPAMPTTLSPPVRIVPYRGSLRVTILQIPVAQKKLPVYALAAAPLQLDTVRGLLSMAAPKASVMAPLATNVRTSALASTSYKNVFVARLGTRVTAIADLKAGTVQILPSMTSLVPGAISQSNSTKSALAIFARSDLIPKDITTAVPASPITLLGATLQRRTAGRAPSSANTKAYLSYVPLRRY